MQTRTHTHIQNVVFDLHSVLSFLANVAANTAGKNAVGDFVVYFSHSLTFIFIFTSPTYTICGYVHFTN